MFELREVTLAGRHVRLEPLAAAHASALFEAASVDRATYALTRVPDSLDAARSYVAAALADQGRGLALPFATFDLASGRIVGSTRFCAVEHWTWPGPPAAPVPAGPDAVEIGWTWLSADAQRTAINTEAKLLMLQHAFEVWRVRRVTLKTDSRNARSRAAMERLGCRFDGILRAHMPAADGGVRNSAMYSLLLSEWPPVKARLQARLEQR